jgi:hypothetical protein
MENFTVQNFRRQILKLQCHDTETRKLFKMDSLLLSEDFKVLTNDENSIRYGILHSTKIAENGDIKYPSKRHKI